MGIIMLRRCETCYYLERGLSPSTGRCGHPERQPKGDAVDPFVRYRELNCYGGWSVDKWRARLGETNETEHDPAGDDPIRADEPGGDPLPIMPRHSAQRNALESGLVRGSSAFSPPPYWDDDDWN